MSELSRLGDKHRNYLIFFNWQSLNIQCFACNERAQALPEILLFTHNNISGASWVTCLTSSPPTHMVLKSKSESLSAPRSKKKVPATQRDVFLFFFYYYFFHKIDKMYCLHCWKKNSNNSLKHLTYYLILIHWL